VNNELFLNGVKGRKYFLMNEIIT